MVCLCPPRGSTRRPQSSSPGAETRCRHLRGAWDTNRYISQAFSNLSMNMSEEACPRLGESFSGIAYQLGTLLTKKDSRCDRAVKNQCYQCNQKLMLTVSLLRMSSWCRSSSSTALWCILSVMERTTTDSGCSVQKDASNSCNIHRPERA